MKEFLENAFYIIFNPIVVAVLVVVGVIGGLTALTIWASSESPEERHAIHQAWIRANKSDISFEDWETLRKEHLLPGQGEKGDAVPIIIPIPIR